MVSLKRVISRMGMAINEKQPIAYAPQLREQKRTKQNKKKEQKEQPGLPIARGSLGSLDLHTKKGNPQKARKQRRALGPCPDGGGGGVMLPAQAHASPTAGYKTRLRELASFTHLCACRQQKRTAYITSATSSAPFSSGVLSTCATKKNVLFSSGAHPLEEQRLRPQRTGAKPTTKKRKLRKCINMKERNTRVQRRRTILLGCSTAGDKPRLREPEIRYDSS